MNDNLQVHNVDPMKRVRARFISGLLVLVPLAATVFVLRFIFRLLTVFMYPVLAPWLPDLPDYALALTALLVALAFIYLVGLVATHIVGQRLIRFGEGLLLKLPIVRSVYSASKQVAETFSDSTQAAFQAVVFIEFPRAGSLAIGFVTGSALDEKGVDICRVFVPTTPNPTSGFLVMIPRHEVRYTDISIEDGLRMIVSGGMLAPKHFRDTRSTSVQAARS